MKESNKANVNDPVFISLSKGLWGGTVFGYEVVYERLTHNYWTCRVSDGIDSGKLLAAAGTRSKALIEAYKNVLNAEQKRLGWVLADKPIRQYGKRGQYGTDVDLGESKPEKAAFKTESQTQVDDEDDASKVPGKLTDFLTTEQKLRIRQFYKIRKDHVSGKGFFLVKFNSEGIYDSGHGPYPTAGEAYEMILELEGVEIPEQS